MLSATRYLVGALVLLITAESAAVAQDVVAVSGTITTRADGAPVIGAVVSVVGTDDSAENLFDVFPDRNITVNSFNGIQTLPSHSPFGMNGRTLYLRLVRTF